MAKNGGSPVLDYAIYWDDPTDLLGYVVLASTTTPYLQYTVTDLVPGHEYRFRLTAINVIGESDQSVSVGFVASALPGVPGQPFKVSATEEPEIVIEWTAPSTNGGSTIQNYFVYVDGVFAGSVPGNSLTYTEKTLLTTGAIHTFTVSAVNAIGEGT